jgi:nucleoside phosphorylase
VGQAIVPPRAIFGLKDTPRHVSHESDYIPRLESLHRRFVLLWDEQDKRGWLVNGTSALLHVLRASLKHSTKGPLRNRLVCRSEHLRESNEPLEVDTAIDVLANEANFNLQLYDGDKHTLLKGQIEHFCCVFEKLFDYQRDAMGDIGKTLCKTPRGSLEGWDFEDLVKKEEQLYPCASRIESAGKGWVDFTRSISAVTVLARDFGEMIKPGGDGFCHHWGELPKGLYYIASALRDLEGLTRRYSRGANNVVQVSESLVWHTPTTCFAACECHGMIHGNRCEPVQTILPAQLSGTTRPRDRQFERRGAGAVIFGHNSYFPWHWEDTGDPVPIQPTNTVALTEPAPKESDSFKDSALGTSPSVSSAGERESQSRTRQLPLIGNNQTHHKALRSSILSNARQHADYTVGIICALPKELRAVRLLFDDGHHESLPRQENDSNTYVLGNMGHHLVVATCLPSKDIGTASAAVTATSMMASFVSVQFILLVGIAGGVRSEVHDIRLGDVVISRFQGTTSGVVSYDQGAENADQSFERRGPSMGPSRLLCAALSIMESAPDHLCFDLQPHLASIAARCREYRRPVQEADKEPRMQCNSCNLRQPGSGQCCEEPNGKPFDLPEIHYGVIASGNRVVKRAEFRDQVAGQYSALCFEMEAAGVFKATSNCLVIRGISDYCDAEKNDSWQYYAAAAAASYARVLLDQIPAKKNVNASHWHGGTEETSRKRRRV